MWKVTAALLAAAAAPLQITVDTRHPVRVFDPAHAVGAGVDGHERGEVARMLSPGNVREMLSTGLQPLAYRLRTELAGEVWHWNPRGSWSDEAHRRGYWISDDKPGAPILLSYGYRLPRRGNTFDQANNDGYSRLDDGDESTFWKSNPYLDRHFAHEDHPQWVAIDFGRARRVNVIRIAWGEPRATAFTVEWADEKLERDDIGDPGVWHTWKETAGSESTVALPGREVRWMRLLLTAASGTAPPGSRDVRDRLGFAVREIYAGTLERRGTIRDVVRHAASRDRQTAVYVSSTDPWHRQEDRDDRIEQPGLDRIFRDGLTRGLAALIPTGMLYDTPENAAAELRYLRARGYAVQRIELGEEPEEQYGSAEDAGSLYLQFAEALRSVDPQVQTGGFSMVLPAGTGFLRRFLGYLRRRNRLADLAFFSFEWYPFDDVCAPVPPQLAEHPALLRSSVRDLFEAGLPAGVPWLITEYGYSAFGARPEVDLEGALLNAEIVAEALSLGADQTFLYGYEPNELIAERSCTWGNNMLFGLDDDAGIRYRTATYHGARLLTGMWLQRSGAHELFAATTGRDDLPAYAVRRPDGSWAYLLINKSPDRAWTVLMENTTEAWQFSSREYGWHAAGAAGHPSRSNPPERSPGTRMWGIPPYSLTVLVTNRAKSHDAGHR